MSRKMLWVIAGLLAIPWILSIISFNSLNLFGDSLFTIGAGTRLAFIGHHEQTFLLYGVINPSILEILIRLGAGTKAPPMLRLVQMMVAVVGVYGLSLTLRRFYPKDGRNAFLWLLIAFLSSPVFMVESFELTPEILMFASLSWLLHFSMEYDGSWRKTLLLAAAMALAVGTRPTAVFMWIPAVVCACGIYRGTSLTDTWRWVLLLLTTTTILVSSLVPATNGNALLLLIQVFIAAAVITTLTAFITDLSKKRARGWAKIAMLSATALFFTLLLFPSYFIHFGWLLEQIRLFHIQREIPAGSIQLLLTNAALAVSNLALLCSGLIGSIGLFTAVTLLLRRNRGRDKPAMTRLFPFLAGLFPFFTSMIRYDNFQPRYLIALAPVVLLASAVGIRFILQRKGLALALIAPLAFTFLSLGETFRYRAQGGVLNAMECLHRIPGETFSCVDVFPSPAEYYSQTDNVLWPVHLYTLEKTFVPMDSANRPEVLLCFGGAPEGYSTEQVWGFESDINFRIRSSSHPDWSAMFYMMSQPWVWRSWTGASVCRVILEQ